MPPSKKHLRKEASRKSNRLRQSKFTKQIIRQDGKCWFCGEELGGDCTREHLLARSLGGDDDPDNIKAAHAECNSAAGSLTVIQKISLREFAVIHGKREMLHRALKLRRAAAREAFGKPRTKRKPTGL